MSQKARYTVELERLARPMVQRTIEQMKKCLNVEVLQKREFSIFGDKKISVRGTCIKIPEMIYPVDVYVDEQGRLIVSGDDMDVEMAARKIKQFYKATNISMITGARIEYNDKNKRVKLRMEVR
jgi:hypothetical protein